jgi:hypothetical protein
MCFVACDVAGAFPTASGTTNVAPAINPTPTPRGTLAFCMSAMPTDTNANGDIFSGRVLSGRTGTSFLNKNGGPKARRFS